MPVLYFAFRHGWRGASLAMLASSAAVTAHAGLQLRPEAPAEAQLFLAVAGTGALLLGAATDALRQSGLRLALQNARLANANQRLDQLAQQLATAARRNLREEEGERKRLAAELHDELGQNLTAIQIRVKIAQNRLETAGLGDVSASINDIVATMRRSVRGLLESLRPAALNEFGLARALDEGPLRDLIQSANMNYSVELRGDLRLLDEDMRNTLYRIVQEAATNCVRHARAHSFSLRLRVGRRGDQLLALLDIRDDGVGLGNGHGVPSTPGLGRGLHGMRDRVLALGGTFRVLESTHGLRLRILLRQPHRMH
ncbi:two-component system sensor histidine kinase [mine drainage metagenome]|uniref:Two-component system sensor histidine kinase n=1 Tax=mine drainage metagenome TaxID=410659 RepID=T0ZGD1_9ZZZZ